MHEEGVLCETESRVPEALRRDIPVNAPCTSSGTTGGLGESPGC